MATALHIVPDKGKPREPRSLAAEALREQIQQCTNQIGVLQRERNQINAERHDALLASEDLEQLRELQAQLVALDDSISTLNDRRKAFEAELKISERRANLAELQRRRAERDQLVREWKPVVARMEKMVDELAKQCQQDMIDYDGRFCRLLPELPSGADAAAFSRDLPGLISRRFEALIRGARGCRGTIETGHELLASGKVDLVKSLTAYVDVIERDTHCPPPEAA